jgi:hypothetical protein
MVPGSWSDLDCAQCRGGYFQASSDVIELVNLIDYHEDEVTALAKLRRAVRPRVKS